MRTFLSLILIFFLFSCEMTEGIELSSKNSVNNERIVFSGENHFYDTFLSLSKMDHDAQIQWIKDCNISSPLVNNLEFCEDTVMLNMPRALQSLFNANLEMQINDSIIIFDNGKLFIKEINKQKLSSPILYANFSIENSMQPTARTYHSVPVSGAGTTFQKILNTGLNDGRRFKYVHELVGVKYQSVFKEHTFSHIYLVLKLEIKKSSWKVANQRRDIDINLNILKQTLRNVQYNQEFLIANYNTANYGSTNQWKMDIYGTITHSAVGYPVSKEINDWTLNADDSAKNGWSTRPI